jgi:hypothetical protein
VEQNEVEPSANVGLQRFTLSNTLFTFSMIESNLMRLLSADAANEKLLRVGEDKRRPYKTHSKTRDSGTAFSAAYLRSFAALPTVR